VSGLIDEFIEKTSLNISGMSKCISFRHVSGLIDEFIEKKVTNPILRLGEAREMSSTQ
jgi:hypothetical protein